MSYSYLVRKGGYRQMDKQSLLEYQTTLREIKKTYGSKITNAATIHEFNKRWAKVANAIYLALEEIKKNGMVSKDREQIIKRFVHDLACFVGTINEEYEHYKRIDGENGCKILYIEGEDGYEIFCINGDK